MGVGWRGPGTPLKKSPGLLPSGTRSIPRLDPKLFLLLKGSSVDDPQRELGWEFLAHSRLPVEPCSSSKLGLVLGKDTAPSLACYKRGKLPATSGWGRDNFSVTWDEGRAGRHRPGPTLTGSWR